MDHKYAVVLNLNELFVAGPLSNYQSIHLTNFPFSVSLLIIVDHEVSIAVLCILNIQGIYVSKFSYFKFADECQKACCLAPFVVSNTPISRFLCRQTQKLPAALSNDCLRRTGTTSGNKKKAVISSTDDIKVTSLPSNLNSQSSNFTKICSTSQNSFLSQIIKHYFFVFNKPHINTKYKITNVEYM